jgi:hypothetical protein
MSAGALAARERCFHVIDRFPQEQLPILADSLESMFRMIDEAMDDAFCVALAERHAARPDCDEPGLPIEAFAAQLGVPLDVGHRGGSY